MVVGQANSSEELNVESDSNSSSDSLEEDTRSFYGKQKKSEEMLPPYYQNGACNKLISDRKLSGNCSSEDSQGSIASPDLDINECDTNLEASSDKEDSKAEVKWRNSHS